ncbi:MAG: AbrB family transcriptional regulator [Pseudomonadota bacterium]
MEWRVTILTVAVGVAGAAGAYLLHVPAPFLLGPAVSVTIAGLAGLRTDLPDKLRDGCFVVVGMGMGSSVTPEVVAAAARWPLSLAILIVAMAGILWGGARVLAWALQVDRTTATLASAPGHLSYVLGLGMETKADLPLLTLIQSLRVLALTLLTPPMVVLLTGQALPRMLPAVEPMAWAILVPLALVAALVGLGLKRLGLPAAMLLGAMATSAVGHGTGITPGGVPLWLSTLGFVFMGSLIGTRFSGVSLGLLQRACVGAALLVGLAVVVASSAAWLASVAFGFSLTSALIAFAPGGVETMAAMAFMLQADPAYVALHHVVRIFSLTFLIPLALPRQD